MASSENVKPSQEPAQQSEANTPTDKTSPGEVRPQKGVFVPNYEPIQTRKRAKTLHTEEASPSLSSAVSRQTIKKEPGRTPNRTRLTRDEVFMPDVGPKPRAVPKRLLILEPEFLPRHLKKKQMKMQTASSSVQIHTTSLVSKSPHSVSWASPSQVDQAVIIGSTAGTSQTQADQLQTVMVVSAADRSPMPADQPHAIVIGSAPDALQNQADQPHMVSILSRSAAGATSVTFPALVESSITSGEMGTESGSAVTQSVENEPASYILATTDGGAGDFITVSDGHIAAETEDGQSVAYTVISETAGGGEEEEGEGHGSEERSDTPTSLLLLAEAAYPTSSSTTQAVIVTQAQPVHKPLMPLVQSPAKSTTMTDQGGPVQTGLITSFPTFMTVSCQGGKSTILTTSTQGQSPSLKVQINSTDGQIPSIKGQTLKPNAQTLFPMSQTLPPNDQTQDHRGQNQTPSLRSQTSLLKSQIVSPKGPMPSLKVQTVSVSAANPVAEPSCQWTCTVCGEVMLDNERQSHLTQHLDTAEEEDGEDCVCETCGEQLKDEEDLELHMAVEHDDEEEEGGGEEEEGEEAEDMGRVKDEEEFEGDEEENASGDAPQRAAQASETMTSISRSSAILTTTAAATTTTVSGNPLYSCEQCGETFQYAAYLRRHIKAEHADSGAIYTCSLCPRSFTSESALEMHSCLHQKPGISFKCIRCSQSFSSASLLSTHARSCLRVAIHTPSILPRRGVQIGRGGRGRGPNRSRAGVHTCSVCGKTFTSEVYLKAHQLSHKTAREAGSNSLLKNQALQCLYCEESFHHLGPLKEHMLGQHPKAFPFRCTICQRGFARDSSRLAHEQTHQTLKLHFCGECGEGFTLQTYLNRHKKYRHLKSVKFQCSICHKEFVRQADCIKHMRVHTGEKPYVCEQCGHGFSQQSNYRYHMMRHRGEKPHVCPMCSKGFRVPSHLKMHMQQHLNERFTCQYCRKVFSQSRYLSRHLRTHTKANAVRVPEHITAAATVSKPETVVVYKDPSSPSQPIRTEQQVIVESVTDLGDHVVEQESDGEEGEPIIELVMQEKEGSEDGGEREGRELAVVDTGRNVVSATVCAGQDMLSNAVQVTTVTESSGMEEQAYVNTDEGTRVVVGAFSEGEGGSMEDGSVTLPFRDLAQLLGGKNYRCDVCARSFGVRPDSMYNMIHTGQSHILVINLNDHLHTHPHPQSHT